MASRNPSSSPSSFAMRSRSSLISCAMRSRSSPTSPRKSLICAPSRASVPLKPREDQPRERDAHGHNGNHFPAHVFLQSVQPILSRPLSKTKPSGWGQSPAPPPRVPAHGGPCFALPSLAYPTPAAPVYWRKSIVFLYSTRAEINR